MKRNENCKKPINAKKVMQYQNVIQNVQRKINVMLPKVKESSRLCVLMTKKQKKEHVKRNIVDQQAKTKRYIYWLKMKLCSMFYSKNFLPTYSSL